MAWMRFFRRGTRDEGLHPDRELARAGIPVVARARGAGAHVHRLVIVAHRAGGLGLGAEPVLAVEHAHRVPGGEAGDARYVPRRLLV